MTCTKHVSLSIMLLLLQCGCGTEPGDRKEPSNGNRVSGIRGSDPGESFSGNLQGRPFVFSHKGFQSYRLISGTDTSFGSLNTERGFGNDRDATVYVLDPDSTVSNQRRFVRLSNDTVFMVSEDGSLLREFPFLLKRH